MDGVNLIRNPEPIGVSRARRLGASVATGSVLVWLDAHMSFAPDWLDRMLEHVDSGDLLVFRVLGLRTDDLLQLGS